MSGGEVAGVRYVLVPVPEWKGLVRLGSVRSHIALEFIEGVGDLAGRTCRFVAESVVDAKGRRIPNIERAVRVFRNKDARVIQRLKEAAMRLNGFFVDRQQAIEKLKVNYNRLFAHRIAEERGITNVDAMLQGITWEQFLELQHYCESDFRSTERWDLRLAILAAVVAGSAGAKGVDGKPYAVRHYLQALGVIAEPPRPKQTLEEISMHLDHWIKGSNRVFEEKSKGTKRKMKAA